MMFLLLPQDSSVSAATMKLDRKIHLVTLLSYMAVYTSVGMYSDSGDNLSKLTIKLMLIHSSTWQGC